MKKLLLLLFLVTVLSAHAQKNLKNEVSIGYFTASEFFDTSAFAFSKFEKGRNFSLKYNRIISPTLSIGITYASCFFRYKEPPYPQFLKDNTIRARFLQVYSLNLGYGVSKKAFTARVKGGLKYYAYGEKEVHFFYFSGGGGWWEPVGAIYIYPNLGAILGASLSHPIIWRFFGELDCEYTRMFANFDRNQLFLSYRIGFRF